MNSPGYLWIDLRCDPSPKSLFATLSRQWLTFRIEIGEDIPAKIKETSPQFLCFEFDYPDIEGLKAIRKTKLEFPFLPILMVTHYHSEELAVWAFRARVWDYMVQPLSLEEMALRLETLFKICNQRNDSYTRTMYSSCQLIPVAFRFIGHPLKKRMTLPAISFIEKNFGDKIRVRMLAELCTLTPAQFSLAFKKENGISIREHLIQFRINKAKQLLDNPYSSITDIAFSVGFNDLSHFTRIFKRYFGTVPSCYKRSKPPVSDLHVLPKQTPTLF
ncbi:MAG: response regulator transcription factor [Nitrospirae bacterium]|nr:response regulator transcription factor [Nitrospirota bacterium]